MSQRPYKKFNRKRESLTIEQKIEKFVLRNSENEYFTKISTITFKFNISEERTWEVVGELLTGGKIESTHDSYSGEMKLCEIGKIYHILNADQKRKRTSKKKFSSEDTKKKFGTQDTKKKFGTQDTKKTQNKEDITPSECHPVIKPKE